MLPLRRTTQVAVGRAEEREEEQAGALSGGPGHGVHTKLQGGWSESGERLCQPPAAVQIESAGLGSCWCAGYLWAVDTRGLITAIGGFFPFFFF